VLTKLDLMDAGTNALEILTGRVIPLKLGFIGVVNRSQQDIVGNKPMVEALKAESEFFKHHPAYRSIATRCGTPFLAKTLNNVIYKKSFFSSYLIEILRFFFFEFLKILMNHIRERLPDIKTRINSLITKTSQELSSYGDPKLEGKQNRVY
jgi:dynamin 1-like protein